MNGNDGTRDPTPAEGAEPLSAQERAAFAARP